MASQDGLQILLVDDEKVVFRTIRDYLRDAGQNVVGACNGTTALQALRENDYDLALIDVRMPDIDGLSLLQSAAELQPNLPVVMITGHPDVETAIRALRLGATDFLTKPIKLGELDVVLENACGLRALRVDNRYLPKAARRLRVPSRTPSTKNGIVGVSPAIQEVRRQVTEAVEGGCEMILITGETGTGKDVTAREIHRQAAVPNEPYVAVSCAAFPDSLIESELFGHVKGAFTGATEERIGYFELANGGTIFLDEAGDLSPSAQAKILRVLETRTLRRVGGSAELAVNVRVIAATNAPLEDLVRTGNFRRDLFYRLNAYSIYLPPLRQRPEDIMPLAEHFLAGYASAKGLSLPGFSPEARAKLSGYRFPGNARELRYLVERAAQRSRTEPILAQHVVLPSEASAPTVATPAEDPQRARILQALDTVRWNRRLAAVHLGIPYSTLRYQMLRLGITK